MLVRTSEPGAWRHPRRLAQSPWIVAARSPELARRYDESASAGEHGKQLLVLRTLIEEFGGEAMGTNLCRRMVGQFPALGRDEADSVLWIRAVLDKLGRSGALKLEDMDGAEVIARVTHDGAVLAYEPADAETTAGAA